MKFVALFLFLSFSSLNAFSSDTNFELITMPDQGVAKLEELLDRAQKSLKLFMFHLSEPELVDKVIELGARGVNVQIILDRGLLDKPSSQIIIKKISASSGAKNIQIKPSSVGFSITHTKAFLIDETTLFISSINFSNAIPYSRDFGVLYSNPQDVAEFDAVFNSDWQQSETGHNATPSLTSSDLVWSPVNSKEKISDLINSSSRSLDVEVENLGSNDIQTALKAATKKGVNVRLVMSICTEGGGARNAPFMDDLAQSGVNVRVMPSATDADHPYIHAKFILSDDNYFFLGSENFSHNSLDLAREVGIIAQSTSVISTAKTTFEKDWINATPLAQANRSCAP